MKRFYLAIFILIALTLVANYNNFVPMLTQSIESQSTASSNTIVTLGAEEASATAQIPKNHFLPPLSVMERIPSHGRSLSLDLSQEVIFLFEDGGIIDILP